jgi:hypothetical protein
VSWLLEDRWTIIGLGALAELLLGVALYNTRRVAVAVGMGVVAALTGLGVLVEGLVVTDREAALATLHDAKDAVLAGDEARVLSFIEPGAEDVRGQVQRYLPMFDFHSIAINAPQTDILEGEQRIARIKFTARVKARPKGGREAIRDEAIMPLEIRLRKEGDRWLITSYEQQKWLPDQQQ